MIKEDYLAALKILLVLDDAAMRDMSKLKIDTLITLYGGLIKNAKALEFEREFRGENTTLPPVGCKLLLKQGNSWVTVLRNVWANSSTDVIIFQNVTTKEDIAVNRKDLVWKHV